MALRSTVSSGSQRLVAPYCRRTSLPHREAGGCVELQLFEGMDQAFITDASTHCRHWRQPIRQSLSFIVK